MHAKCKEPSCENKALGLVETCFRHIKDKKAYISALEAHNKARKPMAGFNFLHADLRCINLSGANLQEADFSGTDLTGAELAGANMCGCDFAGSDCTDTDFTMANLSDTRLWHADLTNADLSEANLSRADFLNANLFNSNLCYANLKDARFLSKENFKGKGYKEGVMEKGAVSARESYAALKQYFMQNGRYSDASWASLNESRMESKRLWDDRRPGFLPFSLMGVLCGWGERPLRAIVSAAAVILSYAIAYSFLKAGASVYPAGYTPSFLHYIYHSTSIFIGGNFLFEVNALYKILAISESFMGIFMLGLFVFSLGRRYSSR